jgi:DNA polymerase-3 subunit delta
MQLNADQLPAHLKRGLAPVYFISGDEPLAAQESVDAIRAAARAAGFEERKSYTVESGFDWSALYADTRAGSLFAARRVIELRLPTGKPGEEGARTLVELTQDPSPDIVLLVTAGKLDKQARAAKWAAALERIGVAVTVYPLEARVLPAWVERRMRARGLTPGPGVAEMLAHYSEGNSLACAQEIDKLATAGAHTVNADDIAGLVGDNARFTVYALTDAALAGNAINILRIVKSLKAEGEAPALVSWALAREIRELARMAQAIAAGRPASTVLDEFRVWMRRKPIVQKALARHSLEQWRDLIHAAARLDRVVKGRAAGDTWLEIESLALAIGGCVAPAYALNGAVR